MATNDLQERTKRFSIRIVTLSGYLSETNTARTISIQLLRSGTSVGANYRAACRAKSRRDFINKLKTVEEEADETLYWLEIIAETKLVKMEKIEGLIKEGNELLAIFVSSLKTARKNLRVNKSDE